MASFVASGFASPRNRRQSTPCQVVSSAGTTFFQPAGGAFASRPRHRDSADGTCPKALLKSRRSENRPPPNCIVETSRVGRGCQVESTKSPNLRDSRPAALRSPPASWLSAVPQASPQVLSGTAAPAVPGPPRTSFMPPQRSLAAQAVSIAQARPQASPPRRSPSPPSAELPLRGLEARLSTGAQEASRRNSTASCVSPTAAAAAAAAANANAAVAAAIANRGRLSPRHGQLSESSQSFVAAPRRQSQLPEGSQSFVAAPRSAAMSPPPQLRSDSEVRRSTSLAQARMSHKETVMAEQRAKRFTDNLLGRLNEVAKVAQASMSSLATAD